MKKVSLKLFFAFIVLPFILWSKTSSANGVFSLNMTVGSTTVTKKYSTVEEINDAIKLDQISSLFPSYNGTQNVSIALDFRGLPMTLSFGTGAASNNLIFSVPDLNINKTFAATTRDASADLFKDFLKKDGGEILSSIMKKLAEVSPSDPVAGNPGSLMGKMVAGDFGRAIQTRPPNAGVQVANNVGLGLRYGSFKYKSQSTKVISLPISYTYRFKSNPQKQILFDLPLTYVDVEGSKAYNISMGLGYRFPLIKSNKWVLIPSLGTGVVGSIDLGGAGLIASGSVTSVVYIPFTPKYRLDVANMIGYYKNLKFSIGGLTIDSKVANTVFRNGLVFSILHDFWNKSIATEYFFIDTRYFGSKLFMESYEEVGASIGASRKVKGVAKLFKFGLSYLFSSKTKGFTVNFGYSF